MLSSIKEGTMGDTETSMKNAIDAALELARLIVQSLDLEDITPKDLDPPYRQWPEVAVAHCA